jgi:G3E family GTPase
VTVTDPLPVTVLSGFLGAGKTTILQKVLEGADGRRMAVIVNDMSEINVDAALLAQGTTIDRLDEELVEMTNGCICCTLRGDLLREVDRLARTGRFDYLVIESTGISEPMPVAATFLFEGDDGVGLAGVARLDTMVTVVDASRTLDLVGGGDDDLAELGIGADEDDDRSVAELVVDQIEFADVVVVTKPDLVDPDDLATTVAFVRRLNPSAAVVISEHGDLDLGTVIDTGRFDPDEAAHLPGWAEALDLDADVVPETEEFGISSFVYRADRPFHPTRLLDVLSEGLPGVIRSKGFCWIATRHDVMVLWSQAGASIALEPAAPWLAATPRLEWDVEPEDLVRIEQRWHPRWGDRTQELAVIGIDLDHDLVRRMLDGCLLDDGEVTAGPDAWATWEDPLPEWELGEVPDHP